MTGLSFACTKKCSSAQVGLSDGVPQIFTFFLNHFPAGWSCFFQNDPPFLDKPSQSRSAEDVFFLAGGCHLQLHVMPLGNDGMIEFY